MRELREKRGPQTETNKQRNISARHDRQMQLRVKLTIRLIVMMIRRCVIGTETSDVMRSQEIKHGHAILDRVFSGVSKVVNIFQRTAADGGECEN